MARVPKVKRNNDFQLIFRSGRIWSNGLAVLYLARNRGPQTRIGICVSRKLGKAVVRNRVKRLVYESYRHQWPQLKAGYDMVVLARRGILERSCAEVDVALRDLLRRARLYQSPHPVREPGGAQCATSSCS